MPIFSLPSLRLARVVEHHVVRHDHVRVRGDPQRARVDAAPAQLVQLVGQHLRVDHDAVADDAQLAGVEDPRRHQVQLPRLAVAHDRVAGVVAALEAHDRVGPLGEQVRDLALPLVAPLGAHDDDAWHGEGQCREPHGVASAARQAASAAEPVPGEVHELRVLLLERQHDVAERAVAVLGDDDVRLALALGLSCRSTRRGR